MARRGKKEVEKVTTEPAVIMFKIGDVDHLRVQLPTEGILWFVFAGGVRYVQATNPATLDAIIDEFDGDGKELKITAISKVEVVEDLPGDNEGDDIQEDESDEKDEDEEE